MYTVKDFNIREFREVEYTFDDYVLQTKYLGAAFKDFETLQPDEDPFIDEPIQTLYFPHGTSPFLKTCVDVFCDLMDKKIKKL